MVQWHPPAPRPQSLPLQLLLLPAATLLAALRPRPPQQDLFASEAQRGTLTRRRLSTPGLFSVVDGMDLKHARAQLPRVDGHGGDVGLDVDAMTAAVEGRTAC